MENPVKNWPTLAEYVDNIRKKIYLRPVGSRIKPFGIRDKLFRQISDTVQKRTAAAELSATIQSASAAAVAAAQAAIHAQLTSSNKQSSSGTASGSGGGAPSATSSTSPAASNPTAPRDVTSAASAATPGTKHPLAPVSSPLRSEGFKTLLEHHNLLSAFLELVEGLENGFNFGIPPITVTRTPPNHKSATSDLKTLNSAIEKEIGLGRACGPYTKEEVEDLIGPFQTSPLGLVPKPNGKWRMVQDFSYPRKGEYPAINNYIASDEFVCAWHGYWDFVDLVIFSSFFPLSPLSVSVESTWVRWVCVPLGHSRCVD
ncbi:hypothetical protein A4X03_0g7316 [Tilletia caries]|uniref:Uncharacterized protein n=1 Tax=Tilletia caries TaxID=13290 RepID=A0A8T8SRW1_9BASI|nr:hypothetical protein A4X03_0g7316 [Tilletia caries]